MASILCDDVVEPQPLWEYPSIALSNVEEIVTLDIATDFESFIPKVIEKEGNLDISG